MFKKCLMQHLHRSGSAWQASWIGMARLFSLIALLCALPLSAHADETFLAPEVAFKFTARMADADTIAVTYAIADGYYMYR